MSSITPTVGASTERSIAMEEAAAVDEAAERKKAAAATGLMWKAPAAMVLVQLIITGLIMLSKVVISRGMFIFALHAYRSAFGTICILPFAVFYERGKWKEMNWRAFGWICLNSCIGYAVPTCLNYYGLRDTTPSYAAVFQNIVPLITFILSIVFRMEKLRFRTVTGSLKVAGILVAVGGTMFLSFYKGKTLHLWGSILHYHSYEQEHAANHHVRGTILLLGSSLTFACWYPIQSMVNKVYPHKYWSSIATCFLGGLQTTLIGIILRRDRNTWKLGWDLQLLTIVYTGVLATAVRYNLESWAVTKRGPVYPPMFIPLITVFTTVLGSIFLGDAITIGSLLGAATVITGLYIFLWGKSKELHRN
ncbi:WAT1-related protein At5g64700-like [Panicum hallii]|nr:WAT1-related protein At5g64700-like [Panicum hallii]XP_025828114.1 WAT1-related protein At5g64700-like [Panicum hallii]XP_025828115.1 WAT1-related protein At5g64700-like [Panicum hallii]